MEDVLVFKMINNLQINHLPPKNLHTTEKKVGSTIVEIEEQQPLRNKEIDWGDDSFFGT